MTAEGATTPPDAPTPDWQYPTERCPHCDERPTANRMDEHVTTEHANLPDCTARIDPEMGGHYSCVFKAGHKGGEYGEWHASVRGPLGRYVWNNSAPGAVPHRQEERTDQAGGTAATEATDCPGFPDSCPKQHAICDRVEQVEQQRDQLADALREVLAAFRSVTDDGTRTVVGYMSAPIHPTDMDRWRAALDPKEA